MEIITNPSGKMSLIGNGLQVTLDRSLIAKIALEFLRNSEPDATRSELITLAMETWLTGDGESN